MFSRFSNELKKKVIQVLQLLGIDGYNIDETRLQNACIK